MLEALSVEEVELYRHESTVIETSGKSSVIFEEIQERYGFVGGSTEEYARYFCRQDLPKSLWRYALESEVKAIAGFAVIEKKKQKQAEEAAYDVRGELHVERCAHASQPWTAWRRGAHENVHTRRQASGRFFRREQRLHVHPDPSMVLGMVFHSAHPGGLDMVGASGRFEAESGPQHLDLSPVLPPGYGWFTLRPHHDGYQLDAHRPRPDSLETTATGHR